MVGDDLDRLDAWVAEARADDAAASRSRERWLRVQAEEQGRFTFVLLDAATRGVDVKVRTAWGALHAGRLGAVGHDFVSVHTTRGATVLVVLDAIVGIEVPAATALGGGRDRVDDHAAMAEEWLADRLLEGAADRVRIELRMGHGDRVVGELRAVGVDVVTVRTDSVPPAECYVPLASVSEVAFLGSG